MSVGDLLAKVQADIERVGWSAIGVFADENQPQFCYTIGFQEHDHPELIIVGLNPQIAHIILADLYQRVADGEYFAAGQRDDHVLSDGYVVEFRAMPANGRPCNMARAYYGVDELPALQIVWPDREGRFPGEEDFDSEFEGAQDLPQEQPA